MNKLKRMYKTIKKVKLEIIEILISVILRLFFIKLQFDFYNFEGFLEY